METRTGSKKADVMNMVSNVFNDLDENVAMTTSNVAIKNCQTLSAK